MKANNKMALNTIILYGRLAVTMVVTLLSSRWVLMALGKEDFGIYNLVAGLLSMLMFLNLTMATATQRFLSFALGKGEQKAIEETFYYSCILHLVIGLIIVVAIEIIGQILLYTVLQIPEGKMYLAIFCLHTLSVSTFATVISVPYNAVLISHENIFFVAFIEIVSAVLKLLSAIVLLNYAGERLKLYAIFMTTIPILQVLTYRTYCYKHYAETRFRIHKVSDKNLFRQLISYAGWNLIGSISSLLRTQGVSMLLNAFYGVVMNAAYGIASQVKGQLNNFSTSIVTATRPQIVKSEGQGNRQRALTLSATTSKIAFLLLSMLSVPLIIEMPYILQLWLKNVPEYTVSFTRLIILINLAFQFSIGISIPIESVGKIRLLQIWVGGLHFIVLPIGYVMLKLGFPPDSIFIMIICEEIIGIALRLFISQKVTGLNAKQFVKDTIFPSILTTTLLYILSAILNQFMPEGFMRLVLTCCLSFLYMIIVGYNFTLTKFEQTHIKDMTGKIIGKLYLKK